MAVAGDALEAASGGEVGVEGGGAAVVDEALGVGERFPEGDVVGQVLRDGPHAGEVGLFEGADDLGAGFFEGHDAEGAGEAVVLAVVPFAPAFFARVHAQQSERDALGHEDNIRVDGCAVVRPPAGLGGELIVILAEFGLERRGVDRAGGIRDAEEDAVRARCEIEAAGIVGIDGHARAKEICEARAGQAAIIDPGVLQAGIDVEHGGVGPVLVVVHVRVDAVFEHFGESVGTEIFEELLGEDGDGRSGIHQAGFEPVGGE